MRQKSYMTNFWMVDKIWWKISQVRNEAFVLIGIICIKYHNCQNTVEAMCMIWLGHNNNEILGIYIRVYLSI